ncbi:hypothetical protein ACFLQW_04855, partial [Candidatus Zixiibacteriota bacterium]
MNLAATLGKIAGGAPTVLRVVSREMPADLETPVSAFLKLRDFGARILLESVESGTIIGRYSFICLQPNCKITVGRDDLVIDDSSGSQVIDHRGQDSPLAVLKNILGRIRIEGPDRQPRLLGGAVGYISYDFIRFFERIPATDPDPLGLPLAVLYLVDTLLVFDHVQRQMKVLCLTEPGDERAAQEKLDTVLGKLTSPLQLPAMDKTTRPHQEPTANITPAAFCETVNKVKQHITAGDV